MKLVLFAIKGFKQSILFMTGIKLVDIKSCSKTYGYSPKARKADINKKYR